MKPSGVTRRGLRGGERLCGVWTDHWIRFLDLALVSLVLMTEAKRLTFLAEPAEESLNTTRLVADQDQDKRGQGKAYLELPWWWQQGETMNR